MVGFRRVIHGLKLLSSHLRGGWNLFPDFVPTIMSGFPIRAVTLPSVSLTLHDLEQSARKLTRDLGRQPGKVRMEPIIFINSNLRGEKYHPATRSPLGVRHVLVGPSFVWISRIYPHRLSPCVLGVRSLTD